MRTRLVLLLAALATLCSGGVAYAGDCWAPPDDTITRITGTPRHGFHVEYYGQRDAYLPTRSEAIAECGEYDTARKRVRCRVRVRTWYRSLDDTKRAIRYAGLG